MTDSENETKPNPPSTEALDRGNWGKPIEFLFACMNYALGLGNVWRFPYLCFRNGGGAFLIPFLIMVLLVGMPVFFVELVIGQYSALGPIKVFSFLTPLFKGLGYCSLVTNMFITIYYMVIIAWILYYMWVSFFPNLIYGNCDNSWNTENCYSMARDILCQENNAGNASDQLFFQGRCQTVEEICSANDLTGRDVNFCFNGTANQEVQINEVITRKLAAEEFFYENVVGIGNATWTNDWGYPQWHLALCLAVAWTFAFFCVFRGVKSIGKVVYFTATFPYVILTALLVRALTMEGSSNGILYFISPQWDLLPSANVWADATSQVFFSFGIAWGTLIVLASFNKFKNNCHFDAVTVSFINFGTAIYNGIVVFAILGFLAHKMNVPIETVTASGPGLVFITYPEAILLMPVPHLWAFLFFFMMLILGIGTQFGAIQMMTSSIIDQWPHLREHEWRVVAGVCLSCFVAALPLICPGGIYLQTLIEWHTASWNFFIIGLLEIVIISWIYGVNKLFSNITEMGMKIPKITQLYWKCTWIVITPVVVVAIFVFSLTDLNPTEFRGYVFPEWADGIGYLFGLATLMPLIVFAVKNLIDVVKGKRTFKQLLTATENWGPQEKDGIRIDRTQLP
ncbi:hypothetical protein HA402_010461 [Bradysia odoriphaga]|nr:hypothetical protein HA402_010461 [Bradysia odoriphaga]